MLYLNIPHEILHTSAGRIRLMAFGVVTGTDKAAAAETRFPKGQSNIAEVTERCTGFF